MDLQPLVKREPEVIIALTILSKVLNWLRHQKLEERTAISFVLDVLSLVSFNAYTVVLKRGDWGFEIMHYNTTDVLNTFFHLRSNECGNFWDLVEHLQKTVQYLDFGAKTNEVWLHRGIEWGHVMVETYVDGFIWLHQARFDI